ncbi:MAG: nucleotidyl transferase AbiEii/AbiGii toxin family protein [Pirellulales bacterium]|nr:nucleotidyl transferase AbiEii/AbiGii toxin family protein [Pirellulales bacterium]MBL7194560.1 nucleotidyl transferase AbiEii/AbiGii toxin family protein [Pirellulales bacterium]
MNQEYLDAVRLLLDVAPAIFRRPTFVLKGGTAINLFVRDMPRLSVDLDLVLADYSARRVDALASVSTELQSIRRELVNDFGLHCELATKSKTPEVTLYVGRGRTRVKVEVNHIFRGTVMPPRRCPVVEEAQAIFFTDIEIPILQPDELYGSKLVAAMDRQHPRDLFDVLGLFDGEGLSAEMIECFVCYLAGHNRPVHEVLFANAIDIGFTFTAEFQGMTREPVTVDSLLAVRQRLFTEIPAALTAAQRAFLVGLVKGVPDWSLMNCQHLQDMPAIRWKLENLARLKRTHPKKFALQARELEARL